MGIGDPVPASRAIRPLRNQSSTAPHGFDRCGRWMLVLGSFGHGRHPRPVTRSKESLLNVRLAVNGTLMRGLALNGNLLAVGAVFEREATTAPSYRLWSIDDRHPAMVRTSHGGGAIAVEVWTMPAAGLAAVLMAEPQGLCVGKVRLADGEETLGVLGEPVLCEGQREITEYGGWRAYIAARGRA
jgi:gamma-glutamylcyclotransferase (GGCT)/AIG2-like uncharacterized protein YtfP